MLILITDPLEVEVALITLIRYVPRMLIDHFETLGLVAVAGKG